MGRRLPPGEAERRAAERARRTWSGADYKTYDPQAEGYGNYAEWERLAEELFGRIGDDLKDQTRSRHGSTGPGWTNDPLLRALGLDRLPTHVEGLTKAFRERMFKVHPDHGGTNDECREVMRAYQILKRRYQ
jgi:hypothetical protein